MQLVGLGGTGARAAALRWAQGGLGAGAAATAVRSKINSIFFVLYDHNMQIHESNTC